MTRERSFRCPPAVFSDLLISLQKWLEENGFKQQRLSTEDGATVIQVEKRGGWKRVVGMSTALNISMHQVENTINVQIGAGRWADKAVVGAVSLVVLWPLAVTAGFGAWQQAKMPERIYNFISEFLKENDA